ncbi:Protein of unknown function [Gryllus bimaculatus]|nr:Protein of unknown function [Gryllus bimaculatus]
MPAAPPPPTLLGLVLASLAAALLYPVPVADAARGALLLLLLMPMPPPQPRITDSAATAATETLGAKPRADNLCDLREFSPSRDISLRDAPLSSGFGL